LEATFLSFLRCWCDDHLLHLLCGNDNLVVVIVVRRGIIAPTVMIRHFASVDVRCVRAFSVPELFHQIVLLPALGQVAFGVVAAAAA